MKITKDMIDPEIYDAGKKADFIPLRNERDFRISEKLGRWLSRGKKSKKISCEKVKITKRDGESMVVWVYSPLEKPASELPGILWTHGGGYACGTPEGEVMVYEQLIAWSPCVIVSPDYRLSVKAPFPAAVEDCYDALLWLKQNMKRLNIRQDQIFLGGGSAGGGLAAALALMSRDRGDVEIAFQMPLYPMLDNTMSTDSMKDNDCIGWNAAKNAVGWKMYLGEDFRSPAVSKYAAPYRETDYRNLPPAFTYVGSCDPFCDETQEYFRRLREAGVHAECLVLKGGYHAFEINSPESSLGKQANTAFRNAFLHAVANYYAPQKERCSINE